MKSKITSSLKIALVCLLAFACLFATTACSSERAVTKAAETFMDAMDSGDFAEAKKLCSSSAASTLGLDNMSKKSLRNAFISGMSSSGYGISYDSLDSSAKNSIDDAIEYVQKSAVKSYTLKDDYDDDDKTISAEVKVLNTSSVSTYTISSKASSLAQSYVNAHRTELESIYTSSGQTAMLTQVINGIMPEMMTYVKTDLVDKMTTETQTWKLTFEEDDGDWIVSKVDYSNN